MIKSLHIARVVFAAGLAVLLGAAGPVTRAWADAVQPSSPLSVERHFDIREQPLGSALKQFAQQAGLQIMYSPDLVAGRTATAVSGQHSGIQVLQKLLEGTGLAFDLEGTTIAVRAIEQPRKSRAGRDMPPLRLADSAGAADGAAAAIVQGVDAGSAGAPDEPADKQGIPEILVQGARTLNTDIRRSEDDAQPYVVFDTRDIQRSQASNLEEFLRTQLPMNVSWQSPGVGSSNAASLSGLNLRGLGENQTLILLDGRRMPGVSIEGTLYQPDINGIPLSAIERIEVLPSTAGGIYGGSATGGVINIVLRRDFAGVESKLTYANTFSTDAAQRRMDAHAGLNLEGGRTQIMLSGSYSDANKLLLGDRDFSARAIALQLRNNPGAILDATNPPLGATVNIRAVSGNLTLKNGTPLISSITGQPTPITHLPLGYAGPESDGGQALLDNAGRYNLDLPNDLNGRGLSLLVAPVNRSVALNVRRSMTSWLDAFVDLSSFTNRGLSYQANVPNSAQMPATSPFNPFEQAIRVRFPTPGMSFESRSDSLVERASAGLIVRFPRTWAAELNYGWNRSRYETARTNVAVSAAGTTSLNSGLPAPDGRPALNALQEGNTYPIDFGPYLLPSPNTFSGPNETIMKDYSVRFSGPLWRLTGGPLTVSSLIERREQRMEESFLQSVSSATGDPTYTFMPWRSQQVDSVYLEAHLPLIGRGNARRLARMLDVQMSARHDDYTARSPDNTTRGYPVASREGPFPSLVYAANRKQATRYMLGARFAPAESLMLRASFSTGFLPPSLLQIAPTEGVGNFCLGNDPKRGNTPTCTGETFTRLTGGNPNLKPESSESLSAGIILTPGRWPGLRFSVDYTRIRKSDEIQTPTTQFILDNQDHFPGRIERGANLPTDPAGWAGVITFFDASLINIASTTVEAFDLRADYTVDTRAFGRFRFRSITTWQPHYLNQVLPTVAAVDSVGYSVGPLEWRANLGLEWDRGPLMLGWRTQFYDSYFVYTATATQAAIDQAILNQGSPRIPRQIYHDLTATYRFDATGSGWWSMLANSEILIGIQNVFDTVPPIVASTLPQSRGYASYGDPRLRRYTLSFQKSFGGGVSARRLDGGDTRGGRGAGR